ncbi:flagellar hook-associated protein FlgL [Stieleria varia]|uniref:Flagellar hook-associated protein 3 n=1 Tax=Stieleria varia TaxID=2528005 RepID=A0A5C6ASA8_9BACT|nr:flagellar hook-associated protein FlgL [Stieleria varia]TWU02381.1 Flagellar hook-associated protein 3 [Stieleria varia]
MTFRVTAGSFSTRAIHFSQKHNLDVLKYQEQISSGLSFQRPSEEPIRFRQVSSLKSRYEELSADRSSINRANSLLNASVSQMQDFVQVINGAKVLAQQGVQANDDDERTALALEVDGLLDQLKGIALTRFNDKYLFSGTRSETPPFTFVEPDGASGEIQAIYNGSNERSRASVGDSITVDTYYTGLEIFGGRGRQPTELFGLTGAKPGAGTDTMVGRADLTVLHGITTYAAGSGIAAGTDSASGDTIIGPSGQHTLTIVETAGDGSAGTISLNGAPAVPFTSADTNLLVTGSLGQSIYVDTTNITAGFNGSVDITSTGFLSVDDGVTQIAIDHSSNQVVVDSVSGGAVTIDSQAITKTGVDHLEFPGTDNAFQILSQLASDLRNSRGLQNQDLALAIDRRLGELSNIAENAFEALGEQASSLKTMDTLGGRVDSLMLSVEIEISEVQATDLPDAVLRMENAQALLQYTYAATADLLSLGLLSFLR